jgi:hypothetical protein
MDVGRVEPARPWNAFDGRRPPHTRPDKGPVRCDIHQLSRADAQYGMHAGLDEESEVSVGTPAPVCHEHI